MFLACQYRERRERNEQLRAVIERATSRRCRIASEHQVYRPELTGELIQQVCSARVVIADVKVSDGEALAASLGKSARFVHTDVCDEASAQAAVAVAVDSFGGVQGLVNCAGIVHGERIVGKERPHSLAGFTRAVNINLIGTFNLIRLAADAMTKGAPNAEGERGA